MRNFKYTAETQDVKYTEISLKSALCDAGADPRWLESRNVSMPMAILQFTSELWLRNEPPTKYPVIWKAYLDLANDGFFHYE
jgi:hypothetical protein